jgi:hypothetical protein
MLGMYTSIVLATRLVDMYLKDDLADVCWYGFVKQNR